MLGKNFKEARFFKKLKGKVVQCETCNRYCVIKEGSFGDCKVRKNVAGNLYSTVFGQALTLSVDPIEKKPLFHFLPGSSSLSVSTFGCNFHCLHCQNFDISNEFSPEKPEGRLGFVSPQEIVEEALRENCASISYTYTEPTVFFEYAFETMKLARKKGLANVWVSNGFMTGKVREEIIPVLDAINIDFKGSEKFYNEVCGNIKQKKVLENFKAFFNAGVHLESAYLIIPGFNDKPENFKEAAEFLHSLSPKIPLHFSAFHPAYKLDYLPRTSAGKVLEAKKIAEQKGLNYVYAGNLGLEENSYCPKCNALLVKRQNYFTELVGIAGGKCKNCGFDLNKDFVF